MTRSQESGQKSTFFEKLLIEKIQAFSGGKSGFVTFLPLEQVNLLQKIRKEVMIASMRTFVTDGRTDRWTDGPGYRRS